jgi:hypothetical protein
MQVHQGMGPFHFQAKVQGKKVLNCRYCTFVYKYPKWIGQKAKGAPLNYPHTFCHPFTNIVIFIFGI